MLSVVGAYAVNNSITDVYWMLAFGVLGYFMKLYGYQVGPVILGVILSRLIDENWRRAIISEQESLPQFFAKLFASPLVGGPARRGRADRAQPDPVLRLGSPPADPGLKRWPPLPRSAWRCSAPG